MHYVIHIQLKNLSLQKIFYLGGGGGGGGGGGVIKYKSMGRCIKFSISFLVLIISEVVCALV